MNKFPQIILSSLYLIASASYADISLVTLTTTGVAGEGYNNTISADGRFVAFDSHTANMASNDTNNKDDVFINDQLSGVTELVSVSSSGEQGNGNSESPSMSADGRFIAFRSSANNLVIDDTNDKSDIFVHDRNTGVTERVSLSSTGIQGDRASWAPSISVDGRFVAFHSNATNLVIGDTNTIVDTFVHDRQTRITQRVNVSSAGEQANAGGVLYPADISDNGRFVAFESYASNLASEDTNDAPDIFVHDRSTGTTRRVSVSSTGVQYSSAGYPSISGDGRFVGFESYPDVLVHDQYTGITQNVNVSSAGIRGNSNARFPSISADGRFVAFSSSADNLVENDRNNAHDVFIHDRNTGITQRASVTSKGREGDDGSGRPNLSSDGRFVAFHSGAFLTDDIFSFCCGHIYKTENTLFDIGNQFTVTLTTTSGATQVGEYIRIRARLKNNSNTTLSNCTVQIINPYFEYPYYQRLFSFYTWPLKVANPVKNGSIDIAPGETGQINLAVSPRVALRREVSFDYVCDNAKAVTIPFINSVYLTAKAEPLIAEDFVQLKNSNNRSELVIDRGNGKYWTGFAVNVSNTGNEPTSVNLTTTSNFIDTILRQPVLCEPFDPAISNWSCIFST